MSNMQKAFKNKAKFGLRMATGGVLSTPIPDAVMGGGMGSMSSMAQPAAPRMPNQGADIFGAGGGSPAAPGQPVAPSLTGEQITNADMITLGTDQGSAPKFLNKSFSDLAQGANDRYKAGGVGDPHASGLAPGLRQAVPQYGAAPKPAPVQSMMTPTDQLFPSRRGLAAGGVVPASNQSMASVVSPPNARDPKHVAREALTAAGGVVDSPTYAAAQFVPAMSLPLGAAAAAVHGAQGRYEELPLDAASMVPGGKGVMLAKGVERVARVGLGGLGRAANGVQALGSVDAFGRAAYAAGGVVPLIQGRNAQLEAAANYDTAPAPQTSAPAPQAPVDPDEAFRAEQGKAAMARANAAQKPKGFLSRLGLRSSGVVQGEGTRTSDSVPASIGTGDEKQKLALSRGEGLLVVSNNTMDNPQAMDQIKQILAASNGGKEPTMPNQGLRGGVQRAANAAVIDPEELMADVAQRHGLANTPPVAPVQAPVQERAQAPQVETPRPVMTSTMYGGSGLAQQPNSPATAYGNVQSAPVAPPTNFTPPISESDKVAARTASVGLAGRAAEDRAWLSKNSDFEKSRTERAPESYGNEFDAQAREADLAGAELGARVLGPNAQVPQGLRASRDNSGGMRLDFSSKTNAANESMGPGNGLRQASGEGVASMRQKDGSFKNIVLGAAPTRWEDGQQYKDAIARNEKDKVTLRDMQHDRIRRTVAMPGATDGDRAAYAGQIKDDEIAATNAKNINEAGYRNADLGLRREEQGLRRDQLKFQNDNVIADNQRANAAALTARDKNTRSEVDDHLKTEATDENGKLNGPKLAWLQRAVAQINDKNMDPDLLAQKKMTHAKALSWLDDAGQHWYSIEKAQDGFTMPDLVEEGDNYRDKNTDQTVSKWRLGRAPVDVQKGFHDMIEMQKAAKNKAAATK